MSLDDGLDKQSYEIKSELKIRKVLESHTDWRYEFTKNDRYDYDLRITEWDAEPGGPEDCRTLGFVELERARNDRPKSWVSGEVPYDDWYYYSFLERKVHTFDYDLWRWGGLKDDSEETVYLKFNHELDNCFAAPIKSIHRDGTRTKRSDGNPKRTTLKLGFDHPDVHTGIEECVSFIQDYLSKPAKPNEPDDITAWGDY